MRGWDMKLLTRDGRLPRRLSTVLDELKLKAYFSTPSYLLSLHVPEKSGNSAMYGE